MWLKKVLKRKIFWVGAIIVAFICASNYYPCDKDFCFESGSLEQLQKLHPVGSDYAALVRTLELAGGSMSKEKSVFTDFDKALEQTGGKILKGKSVIAGTDADKMQADNYVRWVYYRHPSWRTLYHVGTWYEITVIKSVDNRIRSIKLTLIPQQTL